MDVIETPDLSHLSNCDYENVYEPAEDSFLMLDALESEIQLIRNIKPVICLEVGSGSGIISTGLAKSLGSKLIYYTTDINPFAVSVTQRTSVRNGVSLEILNCNLVDPLVDRMKNQVDILIFNPPYVPTEEVEMSSPISRSWAGGKKGRAIMDQLFPIIPQIMSSQGIFYLLIIKENDLSDILNVMASYGWVGSVVKERQAGREFLKVLRFQQLSSILSVKK